MLKNEPFKYIAISTILILNLFGNSIYFPVSLQVTLHTILLVYIGSIYSTKLYDVSQEREVETMKQKDAWMFPVYGSAVLFGLFMVFKLFNKDYVNILFHIYFSFLGTYSTASLFYERLINIEELKKLTNLTIFTIPPIPYLNEKETKIDALNVVTLIIGAYFGFGYFFFKNWVTNNFLGIAFSIFGIEHFSLGQYKVGFILLGLLFFYDIFWVFFTPVMVGVAKNLDGPIKLMFPKKLDWSAPGDFNMIGLGDIVIPGVYVALMLRFDIIKYMRKNNKKQVPFSFKNCKYFILAVIGYAVSIIMTLVVMNVFQAAQPALLYLVPGCFLFSLLPAYLSGDFEELWNYNEENTIEELKKELNN
jgi:minor histocompatibility antigen H13